MTKIILCVVLLPFPCHRNQHSLTRRQKEDVNRERRWTADHMRQLNQVLAGHLSYNEIPKFHKKSKLEISSPAPSHGSAMGSFAHRALPGANADVAGDGKTDERCRSPRRAIIRKLVREEVRT